MSEHYDFHYQPTGSGAISGQQVLQQTEDAINELGDYVNDNIGGAMDVAQQALETAQNAEQDAQTALDTANSFSSAIQSAQQDASTALSTAQTAQTTASNANNTAIQASQDANTAVTTANNASGQVSTLSGTVTTLGQRVTTAEGNIGQNTSDITALTTRVGTAEGNITTLQNDVTIAQGNASSAMATAGQVKQQAYVFRYSSTALVASSTNSNALLDNTDNLKVGDKVIDSSGVLFSITAIDTQNSTFTIGTALVDLAQDSDVVHTSGNETVGGNKTFSDDIIRGTINTNSTIQSRNLRGNTTVSTTGSNSSSYQSISATLNYSDSTPSKSISVNLYVNENAYADGKYNAFYPSSNNVVNLGISGKRWANVYATNYYYGSSEVEFSTKFVTTDTDQTISGAKYFKVSPQIYNSDSTASEPNLVLKNSKYAIGDTTNTGEQRVIFTDKNNTWVGYVSSNKSINGIQYLTFRVYNKDSNDTSISSTINYYITKNGDRYFTPSEDSQINLGSISAKWKSFNGLTPSSLSMPTDNASNVIDISSYITDLSGNINLYTPPANGYLTFTFSSGSQVQIYPTTGKGLCSKWVAGSGTGIIRGFIPVLKNIEMKIAVNGTTMDSFYFIPCQGNV